MSAVAITILVTIVSMATEAQSIRWSAVNAGKRVTVTIDTSELRQNWCLTQATIFAKADGQDLELKVEACPIEKSAQKTEEVHSLPSAPGTFTASYLKGKVAYCGNTVTTEREEIDIICPPDESCRVSGPFGLP